MGGQLYDLGCRAVRQGPTGAPNDEGQAIYSRGGTHGNFALKPTLDEAAYDCPIRFQGQRADSETDLYYNRQRHYDDLIAQFISFDPLKLRGGFRPFGYVVNPLRLVDPFGLTTTLYRAVSPAEASDIAASGQFRPSPGGLESKYFSTSEQGARQYGEMAKRFGENQTIIVKTQMSTKAITPDMVTTVDRGISTVAVPNEQLPQLTPQFLDPKPIQ